MGDVPSHQRDYPRDLAEMTAWVASHAAPGQRVLDVGCGDGSLVEALAARYDAVGVDPEASPGDGVVAVPLEQYESEPFDVVVASVSLHHLHDPDGASAALRRLTRPGTTMLVREFDRDLVSEETTLRWWFHQRHACDAVIAPEHDHDHDHPLPADFERFRAELAGMFDHHVRRWPEVAAMLAAAGFATVQHERWPYLYRWGLNEEVRPLEEALIAERRINAVGIRWTGRRPA